MWLLVPQSKTLRVRSSGTILFRSTISLRSLFFPAFDYTSTAWDNPINASADISKYFGKDSTPGGIGFQFRHIKHYAKSQKECVNSGGDPQTLGIGIGKGEDTNVKGGQCSTFIFCICVWIFSSISRAQAYDLESHRILLSRGSR